MDFIKIQNLAVDTHIGIHEWEQKILQRLLINIIISFDCSKCEDNILQTIDYEKICKRITDYVAANSFKLIETVANKIAILIKNEFNVRQLTVVISKPGAVYNADNIQVHITR